MELSRRGFLGTILAGMAGAAVFDPKSLLWVPEAHTAPVTLATAADVSAQADLNDLAMMFVRSVARTIKLRRQEPTLALREVMYRHVGSTYLPSNLLDVDGRGRGQFVPGPRVMLPTQWQASMNMDVVASEYLRKRRQVDMFAPIGADMRPGTPFSNMMVGVATDPESGLSARALRWEHGKGGFMCGETLTGFEMAGGQWVKFDARKWEKARRSRLIEEYRLKGDTDNEAYRDAVEAEYQDYVDSGEIGD